MQTQTLCVRVRECVYLLPQDTPRTAHLPFFGLNSSDVLSDFYLTMGGGRVRAGAQILQRSGLTSNDLLTYSTCCCLLILLQPPFLLLTGAPCEWDVAAFGDDLYMCEINHFTQRNSISVGEEECIFMHPTPHHHTHIIRKCQVCFHTAIYKHSWSGRVLWLSPSKTSGCK